MNQENLRVSKLRNVRNRKFETNIAVVLQTYREIKALVTTRIPTTEIYSRQEFFMMFFQGILFFGILSSDIFIFSLLVTKVQLKEGSFSYTPLLALAVDFCPLPGNLNSGRTKPGPWKRRGGPAIWQ